MFKKKSFKAHKCSIYIPRLSHYSKAYEETSFNVLAVENTKLTVENKMESNKYKIEKLAVTVTESTNFFLSRLSTLFSRLKIFVS